MVVGGVLAVASACSGPERPVVLADAGLDSGGITRLAADGARVYWQLEDGSLSWIDREGGEVTLAAQLPGAERCESPLPFTVTGDALVWGWIGHGDDASCAPASAVATIQRVPLDGSPAETIATTPAVVDALVADATHVYWAERGQDRVRRAPLAGGAAELVLAGVDVRSLAVGDGIFLLDAAERAIVRVDPAGGSSQLVVDGVRPLDSPLLVDDRSVYWFDEREIHAALIDGGGERTVLSEQPGILTAALDGDRLLFTGDGLWQVDTGGGAEREKLTFYGDCCIALDADYLYLADRQAILRFEKDADMPLDPPSDPAEYGADFHPPFL